MLDIGSSGGVNSSKVLASPIDRAYDWRALAPFVAYCVWISIVIFRHEQFADEAQAWAIARSADSPFATATVGLFEGHPPLWHFILWPLSQTADFKSLKILGFIIATGSAAMLVTMKRFPPVVTVAVLFGSFFSYDYVVLVRPYTLCLFLCMLYIWSVTKRGINDGIPVVICCAIAMTSAFGVLLSIGLAVGPLARSFANKNDTSRSRLNNIFLLFIYLASVGISMFFIVTPLNSIPHQANVLSGQYAALQKVPRALPTALLPHLDKVTFGYISSDNIAVVFAQSALAVFFILAVLLNRKLRNFDVIGLVVGVTAISLGQLALGTQSERHLGHVYLLVLALSAAGSSSVRHSDSTFPPKGKRLLSNYSRHFIALVLLYHVVVGIGLGYFDVAYEQNRWEQVSKFIMNNELDDRELFLDSAHEAVSLLALLDREAWSERCQCDTRYVRWEMLRGPDYFKTVNESWERLVAASRGNILGILTDTRTEIPENAMQIMQFEAGYRSRWLKSIRLIVPESVENYPNTTSSAAEDVPISKH